MNNDLISRQAAIYTDGLDEEIRCEMCKNPMHTDRGCDGNCKYCDIWFPDEKTYMSGDYYCGSAERRTNE